MRLDELEQELSGGTLRGAYLLTGAEPLLRDDALSALRAAALPEGAGDFNLDRFDGSSLAAGALVDAVRTLPVMAPRRLVVVDEPDSRRGAAGKGLAEALAELVAELAGESEPSTVLVVAAAKADKRGKWVKAFGDGIVDCEPPKRSRDVAAFIRAEAARQEIALERGVAERLAERVGPQLLMLRQEIAKLGLLAGPGGKVTAAHVGAGTVDTAEEPIWDLTDAIGEGRAADALRVLSRLLANGAPPIVLLGSLASHFRRLTRSAHGAAVAGPPFVRKKLASQSGRYGTRRLAACLDAIHETDLALKGAGSLRPELALERLVIALAA
jgi:DNA polymerase-3 subunit delta